MDGGWFPILLGAALFTVMASWRRGRELLLNSITRGDPELLPFLQALGADSLPRAKRTAVYAVANPDTVPQALMHNLMHNQVLHKRNLILTGAFLDIPWVAEGDRVKVEPLVPGFWKVTVNYGFKDTPDIQPFRDHLLPESRDHHPDQTARHDAVAREAVRVHGAQRRQHRGLPAAAEQLRDRTRDAGADLARANRLCSFHGHALEMIEIQLPAGMKTVPCGAPHHWTGAEKPVGR